MRLCATARKVSSLTAILRAIITPLVLLSLVCWPAGHPPVTPVAHAQAVTWNKVPCPGHVAPNMAIVRWMKAIPASHIRRSGRDIVRRARRVRNVYTRICHLTLLQPLVTMCPADLTLKLAVYHVAFIRQSRRRTRMLLRVTERVDECITLSVDGHRNLGATSLLATGVLVP